MGFIKKNTFFSQNANKIKIIPKRFSEPPLGHLDPSMFKKNRCIKVHVTKKNAIKL